MEFLDIRLTDYRDSEKSDLTEDRRPAIGKPQQAIWMPVSEMNRSVLAEFQMAFSEVQWSSRRVAYLEASDSARAERCQGLKGPEPAPEVASQLRDRQTPGHLISLLQLPEMRLREPYLEQLLPKPWSSVYDLRGQYAKNLYGQAREEAQAFAADKESGEDAWEAACYRGALLRRAPGARAAAFLDETSCTEENPLWQTLESSGDTLAAPREKGYSGIILEDRLFHLRHRLTEALEAQRFLTSLLEAIGQKPHSDSAQVVYRLMAPERLGGQANPLHRYLEEIDTSRFSPLHTHLLTAQRQLARAALAESQKQLADLVRQTDNQVAMADLFSLSGADYLEGFARTQDLFHVLAIDPNSVDHLARSAPTSEAQVRDANDLVLKIVGDGSDQPLHAMLFPAEQLDEVGSTATESGNRAECGDGRCRPADLEQLPDQPPQSDEVQTLTAAALAGLVKTDAIDLSSESKRWMAAVGAILDGIDKHVRALANRLQSQTYRLDSRLYGPLLRMAKARDPALLGSVQMVARNAVPQGWIILGLRDPGFRPGHGVNRSRPGIHPQSQWPPALLRRIPGC
ncbi:MAG: hypothetical protein MH219_11030 [Marinobacter sp.]|nr:hypothetical protein [Marinobacter sp.]